MKKLKTLICFAVFAVAMLLSVWAITPLTAYAIDQDYNITIADKDGSTTVVISTPTVVLPSLSAIVILPIKTEALQLVWI